ncbi:MAG: hypothetical protein ACPGID_13870 [Rubricella sp.]
MPIVLGVAVLAVVIYGMVRFPRARIPGAVFVAVYLGVFVWQVYFNEAEPTRDPVTIEQVVLADVVFEPDPRLTAMTGIVTNRSETTPLTRFEVDVLLLDCPAGVEPSRVACAVIGEDEAAVYPDVPPGQSRGFRAVLSFTGAPEPRGTLAHLYTITRVGPR